MRGRSSVIFISLTIDECSKYHYTRKTRPNKPNCQSDQLNEISVLPLKIRESTKQGIPPVTDILDTQIFPDTIPSNSKEEPGIKKNLPKKEKKIGVPRKARGKYQSKMKIGKLFQKFLDIIFPEDMKISKEDKKQRLNAQLFTSSISKWENGKRSTMYKHRKMLFTLIHMLRDESKENWMKNFSKYFSMTTSEVYKEIKAESRYGKEKSYTNLCKAALEEDKETLEGFFTLLREFIDEKFGQI